MSALWLTPDEIIELMMAVIQKDGTAAYPYFGRAHLYTGPREEIYEDGLNILGYVHKNDNNHKRAKFLAPILGAALIDEMNISKLVLNDVNGSGYGLYDYLKKASAALDPNIGRDAANHVMRIASKYFINGLWGRVTTSVCGAGRQRIFFDTEFPALGVQAVDLITGLAKSRDVETVNENSIMDIRKLFKLNAIETAYRQMCVNEIDMLRRLAWKEASETIMRCCLDVEEFYMIDRQQGWKVAAKDLFQGGVAVPDLVRLDRKLTRQDRAAQRSSKYCGTPAQRLSGKEEKLLRFTLALASTASNRIC